MRTPGRGPLCVRPAPLAGSMAAPPLILPNPRYGLPRPSSTNCFTNISGSWSLTLSPEFRPLSPIPPITDAELPADRPTGHSSSPERRLSGALRRSEHRRAPAAPRECRPRRPVPQEVVMCPSGTSLAWTSPRLRDYRGRWRVDPGAGFMARAMVRRCPKPNP